MSAVHKREPNLVFPEVYWAWLKTKDAARADRWTVANLARIRVPADYPVTVAWYRRMARILRKQYRSVK